MNFKIFILLFIITSISNATPEISLWTNNQCSKCHINMQGGGLRNAFGKNFGKEASIFSDISLQSFKTDITTAYNGGSNALFKLYRMLTDAVNTKPDKYLTLGFDSRFQSARSHKNDDAVRKFFPMQGSFYISSNPIDLLTFEGQYNVGPKIFQGQKEWSASAIINYSTELPKLRIGYFQPSIGIRDCDMTSFDRKVAFPDGSETIIAPDFAELGTELIYEPKEWLSIFAGAFDSRSLNEVLIGSNLPVVMLHNPSFNAKVAIYPSWLFEDFIDSYFGASVLINGDFKLITAFAGIALEPELQFYLRYTYANKPNTIPYERTSNNIIAGTTYIPYKGLILGAKAEIGATNWDYSNGTSFNINSYQFVLNAKLLTIPFVEILPEYRWLITEEYSSSRWALQFHLYY